VDGNYVGNYIQPGYYQDGKYMVRVSRSRVAGSLVSQEVTFNADLNKQQGSKMPTWFLCTNGVDDQYTT
jgi:hypothetical protein